jgi:polysaccharide deacetylase family sporulation protein PdaB
MFCISFRNKTRRWLLWAVAFLLFLLTGVGINSLTKAVVAVVSPRRVPIYYVQTDEAKIAISFDATWGAEHTPRLLEILRKKGIRTTFFLCGYWIEKYPEMVTRIAQEGHEIANHSLTHPHMNSLSAAQIEEELLKTHKMLVELTGQEPYLFRPPFGEYSNKVVDTAEKAGYITVQWSVDSLDWQDLSSGQIAERVLSRIHNGSIVLFHNNGKHTPDAIETVIDSLEKSGYSIVPVGELILKEDYYVDPSNGAQKRKEKGKSVFSFFTGTQNKDYTIIYRGNPERMEMAFGINVAWGEEHIPDILESLRKYGVRVTFFFVGSWVEKYPELTRQIAESGHEVGNHGFRHLHVNSLNKGQIQDLIKKNELLLKEVTGSTSTLFTPPYGEVNEFIAKSAGELGYTTIMWTVDTVDWKGPSANEIEKKVLNNKEPGAIVLMHPMPATAEALPKIIESLKSAGYNIVPVSRVIR